MRLVVVIPLASAGEAEARGDVGPGGVFANCRLYPVVPGRADVGGGNQRTARYDEDTKARLENFAGHTGDRSRAPVDVMRAYRQCRKNL